MYSLLLVQFSDSDFSTSRCLSHDSFACWNRFPGAFLMRSVWRGQGSGCRRLTDRKLMSKNQPFLH